MTVFIIGSIYFTSVTTYVFTVYPSS